MTREQAALLDLISDDVYGLWEVDWWFNGRQPQWDREQRAACLRPLIEQELVDVFFGPLRFEGEPLGAAAALEAIRAADHWRPPELDEQSVYHVMTNAKGNVVLRSAEAR